MSDQELLNIIIEHGLSIRQIPKFVVNTHEMRHYNSEKHTIIEIELKEKWHYKYWKDKYPNSIDVRFDDENKIVYRKYVQEIKVPQNAGCWMCKQVKNTSSRVEWSIKDDNLAPTLLESIMIYLKSIEN